jgi:hypothetical protein
VWETTVQGQQLNFRLAGINNQNYIMRDEETGTWWQQVSGAGVQGEFKGQKLNPVFHDEVTFGVWKRENPNGRVLRPDEKILQAGKYASPDWEARMLKTPVATSKDFGDLLEPRALIVGIKINGDAKAYPMSALEKQSPVVDRIGGRDIIVVLGEDKKSVRAFETTVDGRKLEFLMKPNVSTLELADAETGSSWDFTGKAVSGELAGKQLVKIPVLKDYWFDWKGYNPETGIYSLGDR